MILNNIGLSSVLLIIIHYFGLFSVYLLTFTHKSGIFIHKIVNIRISAASAQKPRQQCRRRSGKCHHNQRLIEPCQHEGHYRADRRRKDRAGRIEDGGDGHGSQYRIGHIVQKAFEKWRGDFAATCPCRSFLALALPFMPSEHSC